MYLLLDGRIMVNLFCFMATYCTSKFFHNEYLIHSQFHTSHQVKSKQHTLTKKRKKNASVYQILHVESFQTVITIWNKFLVAEQEKYQNTERRNIA